MILATIAFLAVIKVKDFTLSLLLLLLQLMTKPTVLNFQTKLETIIK